MVNIQPQPTQRPTQVATQTDRPTQVATQTDRPTQVATQTDRPTQRRIPTVRLETLVRDASAYGELQAYRDDQDIRRIMERNGGTF